jgi:hypothetical protein
MPVTSGIKCAYCEKSMQSDYQMNIHLKEHKQEIKSAKTFNRLEAKRIEKNQNG